MRGDLRGAVERAILLGCVLVSSSLSQATAAVSIFDLSDVEAEAAKLAAEPYADHRRKVPEWMLVGKEMTYDQWRDIRFRPDRALWRDRKLPFHVQFFHPGLYYASTVTVNVVGPDGVREVPFSTELFDYGKNDFARRIPKDIGYAGFRVHYPLKNPNYYDELIVFLGASYFRAVGRDQVYGLSARGLAIDTVEPSGEEFPHFTEFWIVEPAPNATSLVLYALLESPSATGAYRFEVVPGAETRVDVEARLHSRRAVKKLGIAPLTSMFFYGENGRHCFDDFRPEVHDSDGLLLSLDGGEWLWRPLDNPPRIAASGFAMLNPRGFGLLQRDRDFASYQDLETRSEQRPSAWIEPRGDWGAGRVELVEIPTDSELTDNIVAFWVPDAPPGSGGGLSLSYSLYWYGDDPARPPGGRVFATRQDHGTRAGGRRLVIDFAGGNLASIPADRPPLAEVSVAGGEKVAELRDVYVVHNPSIRGWRLGFQVEPRTKDPIELRAYLKQGSDVLSETWSYAVLP